MPSLHQDRRNNFNPTQVNRRPTTASVDSETVNTSWHLGKIGSVSIGVRGSFEEAFTHIDCELLMAEVPVASHEAHSTRHHDRQPHGAETAGQ